MKAHKHTNQLVHETSPYLLQHAHNPVDWHPWNKATLEKAKKSDKMILVSIGYSACHWCHVMEHESFEDEQVAEIMNAHFICIKVDREERPDVDQVYMDAVQTISGRGGWPLNCFALPDGKPFWGATYFQRDQWVDILNNVVKLFSTQRKKLEQQAKDIFQGISSNSFVDLKPDGPVGFSEKEADEMAYTLGDRMDREEGGFKGAPKFPMPNNILFMLRYHFFSGNPEALELVNLTLMKMARGGIYDQLGGGFARYSVDGQWHVPHFEKMLYDNAQLISLYAEAYQLTKDPEQEKVIRETMDFIKREMTSPEKGFYSALDADSEGEEGKFYVWSKEEFEAVAGADAVLLSKHFGMDGSAYWEDGKHVLVLAVSATDLAIQWQLPLEEVQDHIRAGKQKLLDARSKRARPGLDDKILTSWNALMLKACVDAYRALDENSYLELALDNAGFLWEQMYQPGSGLYRSWKNGQASIPAFLDDYSFLMEAMLSLYEVTFDEKWAVRARLLAEYTLEHFLDEQSGMFFYTSDVHEDSIARKMEVADNVIPSSSSVLARVLYILGILYENTEYAARSETMLTRVQGKIQRFPSAFSNWGMLFLNHAYTFHTAVVTGREAKAMKKELMGQYLPHVFYAGGELQPGLPITKNRWSQEKTRIFVCTADACQLPEEKASGAMKYLEIRK